MNYINTTIPRREYRKEREYVLTCPECKKATIKAKCTTLLIAASDDDEGEFITNAIPSYFCETCPVVVFDRDGIRDIANRGLRGDANVHTFGLLGFIDPLELDALESEDDIPPIITFLPTRTNKRFTTKQKVGKNAPCPCGSGKKYKRCHGK